MQASAAKEGVSRRGNQTTDEGQNAHFNELRYRHFYFSWGGGGLYDQRTKLY